MAAPGYRPTFHMPIIGPPLQGGDPVAHYTAVSDATAVQVTAVAHQGLLIQLTNPVYNPLFAMAGGLVRFIPQAHPLPIHSQEPVQGAGALFLEIWADDFTTLKRDLPPGVPAMTNVLYLNAGENAVRAALKPHVQALIDSVLQAAWSQPTPAPGRSALEQNYLDRLLLGQTTVFVPGGTLIGEAAGNSTASTSPKTFILRFTDCPGNDLSPILHLRAMESYGGLQWHGHPLVGAVSNISIPINIYVQSLLSG